MYKVHGHRPAKGNGETHPLYSLWRAMRHRCLSPKNREYHLYGGRGITICERWNNFATFVEDVEPRPSPAHTLDRIDNDGNYEPGNTRWALKVTQARNSRKAKLTEAKVVEIRRLYAGGGCTHKQLGEMFGVHKVTIQHVIQLRNWKM